MNLLKIVNKKHIWNSAFIEVVSNVFISIVIVSHAHKQCTRLENSARDQHSSLLRQFVNYRQISRVARLGDFSPIGLLLEAHYDLLEG
jgi:hypothetical protein